jgi:two-component system sensor histidine kinase AlgZ
MPAPELPSEPAAPWAATAAGELPKAPAGRAAPGDAAGFDVCHSGVVLRAVLGVHAVLAVGIGFAASDWRDAALRFGTASAAALPGLLVWLIVACAARRPAARLQPAWQWTAAIGLGGLLGPLGALGLGMAGLIDDELRRPVRLLAAAAAGALAGGALFAWLRLRARAATPAETAARLAELQSRIRPHFLFNTLNTALALVRVDPSRAEEVLEDLAELFRVALQAPQTASVTLDDEIDLARRYLAIEQIRFGTRLTVRWELDAAAGRARVPPLLLQPLVENAVRHGIEPADGGGLLRVRTQVQGGRAVLTIDNTLPVQAGAPGHGIALRNVRERLALLHDVAGTFEAGRAADRFRVRVAVPL